MNPGRITRPTKHARNGHWTVQIDYGKNPAGKRIVKTFTGKTKKIAQDRAYEYLALNPLPETTGSDQSLEAYLNHWYNLKKVDWAPRTQEVYELQIRKHIIPALGHIALNELTPMHVQTMMNGIAEAGTIPTANKCRRLLYTALKQAVRWELISRNVVENIDPFKETPRDIPQWTSDEVLQFLDHVRPHRLYAAFYLLVASGIRRGELLGLRWKDVTPDGIRIEQAIKLVKNRITIGPLKTKNSRRFVPLGPDAIQVLEEHRKRQEAEYEYLAISPPDHDLVFTSELATPMDPKNLFRVLRVQAAKAGLKPLTLHAFRHLHASFLIYQGTDIRTVSGRLGHASPGFTLQRYSKEVQEYNNRSGLTVQQILKGKDTPPPSATVSDEEASEGKSDQFEPGNDSNS